VTPVQAFVCEKIVAPTGLVARGPFAIQAQGCAGEKQIVAKGLGFAQVHSAVATPPESVLRIAGSALDVPFRGRHAIKPPGLVRLPNAK